ncbi:hypothetical protein CAPTEDRAFT_223548 [Capitella teleta]|uniref:PH domain-containing protein n=1 Tax=Capitella teleta TaxID=283909 RepID=R7UGQ6_CAPTE|nr:hypothetical protein CAPTEDRAFT_223548 [Capitella teleta]|eukprot:ELU05729.1 hypothetical protein CAPTEDRAFT_223548 [Capitella teleta]
MEEEEAEVIFESWLYKLHGSPHSNGTFRLPGSWRKRYFILFREKDDAFLQYYDKKPKVLTDNKKDRISLKPSYTIEKCQKIRGRENVCLLTTHEGRTLCLAAEDAQIFHLFVFFVQTQTRLREEFEAECFVVRPETSEDHQRLGARGSMCFLHVSQWGLTMALQLSKCVLAQWPLNCIKSYETTGKGQFAFEAGNGSLCGKGSYIFNTRRGQENILFDTLDRHVNELAGLQQIVTARGSIDMTDGLSSQLVSLQALTITHSDARFIPHLKKISREIYDHLAEHLGGSSSQTLMDEASLRLPSTPSTLPTSHNYSNTEPQATSLRQEPVSSSTYLKMMGTSPEVTQASSPERQQPPMMRRINRRRSADEDDDSSHAAECRRVSMMRFSDRFSGLRTRLRSRSADDLNEYTSMSKQQLQAANPDDEEEVFAYENESYEKSPETTEYCYARTWRRSQETASLSRGMRKSLSNPDILNDTHSKPPKFDFSLLNGASSPTKRTSANVKTPTSALGVSASPQTRVFTRSNKSPVVSVLRQESGRMHGRQLPSLPPQNAAAPKPVGLLRSEGPTINDEETDLAQRDGGDRDASPEHGAHEGCSLLVVYACIPEYVQVRLVKDPSSRRAFREEGILSGARDGLSKR